MLLILLSLPWFPPFSSDKMMSIFYFACSGVREGGNTIHGLIIISLTHKNIHVYIQELICIYHSVPKWTDGGLFLDSEMVTSYSG